MDYQSAITLLEGHAELMTGYGLVRVLNIILYLHELMNEGTWKS